MCSVVEFLEEDAVFVVPCVHPAVVSKARKAEAILLGLDEFIQANSRTGPIVAGFVGFQLVR